MIDLIKRRFESAVRHSREIQSIRHGLEQRKTRNTSASSIAANRMMFSLRPISP